MKKVKRSVTSINKINKPLEKCQKLILTLFRRGGGGGGGGGLVERQTFPSVIPRQLKLRFQIWPVVSELIILVLFLCAYFVIMTS